MPPDSNKTPFLFPTEVMPEKNFWRRVSNKATIPSGDHMESRNKVFLTLTRKEVSVV